MASFRFVLVVLGFVWLLFFYFCFSLFFYSVLTRPGFVSLLELTLSQPTKTSLLCGDS